MNAIESQAKVCYCPACLHVVSMKEETCRHCGHRYGPSRLDRFLARAMVWTF